MSLKNRKENNNKLIFPYTPNMMNMKKIKTVILKKSTATGKTTYIPKWDKQNVPHGTIGE